MTRTISFGQYVGALGLAALLAACSSSGSTPSTSSPAEVSAAPSTSASAAATADQEAELATVSADLERDLWSQTGLEKALGGAAATDAAFDAVTAALIEQATALGDDPSYGRFGGAVHSADEVSLGGMMFAGWLVTGIGTEAMVKASNDLKPGETPEPLTRSDDTSTFTLSGTLAEVNLKTTLKTTADGVTGTLVTTIEMAPCPDANGVFTAKVLLEASATSAGGRTGSNTSSEVTVTGRVGDDAELAGYDTTSRTQAAEFKASKGSYVDVTASTTWAGDKVTALTQNVNRTSGSATPAMAEQWTAAGALVESMMSRHVLTAAEQGWKSGRCVDLKVTTAPAKRTGLAPSASVTVTAAPTSKIDGSPAGGTVAATLVGATSIDPSETPVPADGTFTYVAPGEKDQAATVSFEATSKRGVAKANVDFDTKASPGYFIGPVTGGKHTITGLGIGSTDDGSTMGTAEPADVCDITKPFTLTSPGTGGRQTFTPTSETTGTTTYETVMPLTGFMETGKGTYTLTREGEGGTIRTKVKGKLVIPGAGQSYKTTGVQLFSLQPATTCS